MPSAGDSSAQSPKDAPATRVPSSNARLATTPGRCRSRGPRGRACRSPARARRRPRPGARSCPAPSTSPSAVRSRPDRRPRSARPPRSAAAARPTRHRSESRHAVAVGALEDAGRRHRAVTRPAPHPVQPHAGERRRGRRRRPAPTASDPEAGSGRVNRPRAQPGSTTASRLTAVVTGPSAAPSGPRQAHNETSPARAGTAAHSTASTTIGPTNPRIPVERSRKGTDSATHPVG